LSLLTVSFSITILSLRVVSEHTVGVLSRPDFDPSHDRLRRVFSARQSAFIYTNKTYKGSPWCRR
jgi:hypothetical protein